MDDPRAREPWLPDLCRLPRVGAMLGLAELVVVIVAAAPDGARGWSLWNFISASGYALWLALAVTLVLCKSRAPLSRLPAPLGALLAVAVAMAITVVCAGIIHQLNQGVGTLPALAGGVGFWRFCLGSAGIVGLIAALALRYFYVSDRWAAQLQASARAQADALQARIRPHFLFNSMNLIASLLRRDPEVAERAVLDLSDLFRAALSAGDDNSSLRGERELAERYLEIEGLRLGERLRVHWELDDDLPWTLPMPQLVLQPLVENAVLHGISPLAEGGTLAIAMRRQPGRVVLSVRNPAPEAGSARPPVHRGNGHAQRSIAHRLAHRFGSGAQMTAGWRDGYYECVISIPTE